MNSASSSSINYLVQNGLYMCPTSKLIEEILIVVVRRRNLLTSMPRCQLMQKKIFFASGFLCPDALMLRRLLIKIDWNYFLFMPCSLLCIDKTPRFLDAIAFPLLILFTYSTWSTFRLFSSLLFYWCCKAALIRRDGWSTYARCLRKKKIWKHRTDNLLDIFPGVMLKCSVVFWTTHAVSVGGKVQGWGSQSTCSSCTKVHPRQDEPTH